MQHYLFTKSVLGRVLKVNRGYPTASIYTEKREIRT